MQSQKLAIITSMVALLFAVSAVLTITPESVSAYQKNQAASQTSECGNGFISINIGCQSTDSQIQGDENAVALTAQQTFPEVKLVQKEPKPSPTPMTATLQVCKDATSTAGTYEFIVTGNNPSTEQFSLMPNECEEVIIGPGSYEISEEDPFPGEDVSVTVTGDCMLTSDVPPISASGNIQAGEVQSCSFLNIETCEECVTAFLTEGELAEFFAIPNLIPQNIEELCELIETPSLLDDFREILLDPNRDGLTDDQIADDATIEQLINCLERVFGLQTEEPIES